MLARPLYLAGGFVALGFGAIGIALPIMPTVPFLLLAAFCFARSHPQWAQRLYDHPVYGSGLRDWRDRKAISRKAKLSAVIAMGIGAVFTWFTLGFPWVIISLAVLIIAGTWIWTRAE